MPSDPISDSDEIIMSPKLISPAAIGIALLLVINYFTSQTFTTNPLLVAISTAAISLFALSHFIPIFRFGRAHAFYLYTYHWILGFLLLFVVPTLSYYLYIWVMLMYLTEFYYQAKGALLSAGSLLIIMVVGSFYQNNGLSWDMAIRIAVEFCVILTVNLVMTRLAFGNRQQRKELSTKIVRSEYEHGRLVALINSMSDAVIATDEDGKILNYNAAALDILNTNMTLSEMLISNVMKLVNSDNIPVDALGIAQKTTYLQRRTDLSIPISKGDKVDLDMSVSRIARSTLLSKQQGYTFLLRDITQQKSLDEERDMFISEVSHELRTPITIAEGDMSMAVLLIDKPDRKIDEIKRSVVRAHDQVIFLADMVNDLSALSRAQRDDKDMEVETFTVTEVLSELEQTYRPQAEKKGLYFKLDIAPSVPSLTTSRLYFREIMQNFITNAIKYTTEGGITVKGQAIDRDNILISISDTGVGISKSEQSKVYQKFWRSEDPYTRATSGTGLGLFITSKLAQRIDATLKLDSKFKEGSTFSIIVPVNTIKTIDQKSAVKNEVAHIFD